MINLVENSCPNKRCVPIDSKIAKANLLLFLTAAIWGFAFVAQRAGMAHVGPFTFNAVRFALGSFSLVPLVLFSLRNKEQSNSATIKPDLRMILFGGIAAGIALFAGSSLQQIGIVYTTAGKAGFITGLYVILVPIMGIAWRQKSHSGVWFGALLAVTGLYLLSVTEKFTISPGDFLVLLSAFFWAAHVLLIGWLSRKMNPLLLALLQFFACSLFSFVSALFFEEITLTGIKAATIPILYAGLFSVGIAYTLQIYAQRHAPAANAAIILSLEAVFAVLGGRLLLNESLSLRGLVGCSFMLTGMILSQMGNVFHIFPLRLFSRKNKI